MKCLQVILIFAIAALHWSNGERSQLINHKQLNVIANSMDPSVEPCENFYQYACGKWPMYHAHQPSKYDTTAAHLKLEINEELVKLLEEINLKNKPEFVKKAYNLLTSCNEVPAGKWRAQFYMDWMQENEKMTWALLPHSNETTFDWVHALGLTLRYNLNDIYVKAEVIDDVKGGPTKLIIGINKEFTLDHLFTEKQLSTLEETLPQGHKALEDTWTEMEVFQARLYGLRMDKYQNVERKLMRLDEVEQVWLQRLVHIIMGDAPAEGNFELYIENVEFFKKLDDLLAQYDDWFLSMYLELHFLNKFYKTIPEFSPTHCMALTTSLMPLAMNYIYEIHRPELLDQVPKVQQIFEDIVHSFNDTIANDHSGLIAESFVHKLNNVQLKVGNLPRVDTEATLDKYYANLEVSSMDFKRNHIRMFSFAANVKRNFNTNNLAANVETFFDADSLYTQSPYWVPNTNFLMVPSFHLRQPVYHWGYDEVFLYSGLGMYITSAISGEIRYDFLSSDQKLQLSMMMLLHYPFKAYSSKFPDALKRTYSLHDINVTSQQLYFLNAGQFFCRVSEKSSEVAANILNPALSQVAELSDAFGCKAFGYTQFFNNFQL